MHSKSIVLMALVAVASVQGKDRKFLIKNNCKEDVWPGIFNTAPPAVPIGGSHRYGFHLMPQAYKTLIVPDQWGGRIWPRTKCNTTEDGKFHCLTGDCEGDANGCDPIKTGEPCTLGEWTLATENPTEAGPFSDWYDLSLVDGFSIPMQIIPSTKECKTLTCALDMMPFCPKELLGGAANMTCLSACKTGSAGGKYSSLVNGTKTISDGDRNCCSGPFGIPQTCSIDMVDYYQLFKKSCPDAYAHAYDDETSLQTCDKALQPDYTITFCPDPVTKITPPPSEDPSYAASNVCVPKGFKLVSGGGDVKPTKNCVPVVPKGPGGSSSVDPNAPATQSPSGSVAGTSVAPAPTTTPVTPAGTGDDTVPPSEEGKDVPSKAPASAVPSESAPPSGTPVTTAPSAGVPSAGAPPSEAPSEGAPAMTGSSVGAPSPSETKAPKLSCKEKKKKRAALKRMLKVPAARKVSHEQL